MINGIQPNTYYAKLRKLRKESVWRLLLILQGRHAKSFSESQHEIRAIRKTTLMGGKLHALPHPQKPFGFCHTAGFNIGGRTRLKIRREITIHLAFGNKQSFTKTRNITIRFVKMMCNIGKARCETYRKRGDRYFFLFTRTDDIKDTKKVVRRAKRSRR